MWDLTSFGEVQTEDEQKIHLRNKLCNILEGGECYKNVKRFTRTREIEDGEEATIFNGIGRVDWSEKMTLEQRFEEGEGARLLHV